MLQVPLEARRAALEAIPWVAQASVAARAARIALRVELTERTPVAFLRAGNQLALVDADGIILDRPLEGDFHFPVVSGFDETMPLADRAKRMRLFVEFMKEIDLGASGRERPGQRSGSHRRAGSSRGARRPSRPRGPGAHPGAFRR